MILSDREPTVQIFVIPLEELKFLLASSAVLGYCAGTQAIG